MRERCRLPSRYQCIRYVVSYPRLSRMTRRNGTPAYLRFWDREDRAAVALRALFAAGRRGAAAFALRAIDADLPLTAAVGRRRPASRSAPRRTAATGSLFGAARRAGAFPSPGCGARWTS